MGVIMHKGVAYGGGSNVEANPAGSATDDLSKLGIDGTVYDVTDADAVHSADVGVADGVAGLDSNGKVPSAQLPTYPTVNDSTITIQKNGTTVDTFTTNQSSAKTINITMAKADVGLGNVPNVATDDQTPTVAEASTRTNLASGDTLKTIVGKIKKFFSDLKTVAFTGSYSDLTDKPTIPSAQVQSDWNQTTTTAVDYIKNKPTIPAAQVNSDWNASSGVAQILNKPTIPSVATKYDSSDAAETTLADDDKVPFYDTSASGRRNSTWANIKAKLKSYFDGIYSTFSGAYSDLTGKPTLGTAAAKDVPSSGNASSSQVVMGNDTRLTDARNAADVYSWAKASTKPSYTASEVGAIPLSGSSVITGSLIPNTDNNIDLGSPSKRYQDIYSDNATFSNGMVVGNGSSSVGFIDVKDQNGYTVSCYPSLTGNRAVYFPDENGTIATHEYIASNIGVFYTATWKATSSSANATILTNDMVLPKGKYIIDVQSPQVNSNTAIAGLKAQTGTIVKPVENVWFYLGLYNHLLTSIEVTSTTANVTLVTGFSASVTYSYTDRAYIRAIRVG